MQSRGGLEVNLSQCGWIGYGGRLNCHKLLLDFLVVLLTKWNFEHGNVAHCGLVLGMQLAAPFTKPAGQKEHINTSLRKKMELLRKCMRASNDQAR